MIEHGDEANWRRKDEVLEALSIVTSQLGIEEWPTPELLSRWSDKGIVP